MSERELIGLIPPMILVGLGLLGLAYMIWSARNVKKVPFKGTATITSKKYVPRRRSGSMAHSTSPSKHLIYYKTDVFEYRINSEDLFYFLDIGEVIALEGTIIYKIKKDKTLEFDYFDRDLITKAP